MMESQQLDDTAAEAAVVVVDPWDALGFDPHAKAVAEGRRQGAADGRAAGWRQGYATGRTTAAEYGTELGFVRGVVSALQEQYAAFSNSETITDGDDRLQNSIRNLLIALDDFPSPVVVFRNMIDSTNNKTASRDPLREEDPDRLVEPADEEVDANTETNDHDHELDVAAKMQRVRARFKLLMVQLGLPHFSLKSIMDQQQQQTASSKTSASNTYAPPVVSAVTETVAVAAAAAAATAAASNQETTEW